MESNRESCEYVPLVVTRDNIAALVPTLPSFAIDGLEANGFFPYIVPTGTVLPRYTGYGDGNTSTPLFRVPVDAADALSGFMNHTNYNLTKKIYSAIDEPGFDAGEFENYFEVRYIFYSIFCFIIQLHGIIFLDLQAENDRFICFVVFQGFSSL